MQTVGKKESPGPSEARCECGQLVAKLGVRGIELKCKRCKRLVSIPLSSLSTSEITFQLCDTHTLSKTPV
jgi:phage FluMu protein Com